MNAPAKSLKLDLTKSAAVLRMQLDKAGVAPDIKAELVLVMDVSSSFEHEHEEGTTSILVERLVPVAIELDPDRQIDVVSFSNGPDNVQYVGTVDETNCTNYVVENIVDQVQGWKGGTDYSYALEEALMRFGWMPCDHAHKHDHGDKPGFWTRFFGRPVRPVEERTAPHNHERKRSIVLFVTDGECDPGDSSGDKRRTREVLRASQERGDEVYFLFIGACEHADFEFVRAIADEFKNTGIVMATDPEEFVGLSDEDLMKALLVDELIEWLKK